MTRRSFIAGLGSAAAWPVVARGQQVAIPVIGFLNYGSSGENSAVAGAFRRGLAEQGFFVGQNVEIVYASADNQADRLPELVAGLIKRDVAVIAAGGGPRPAQAAKAATTSVPVVFETGLDPVLSGLVESLNHPGGNVTGINSLIGEMWPKQIDLMAKVLPNSRIFALMYNGNVRGRTEQLREDGQRAAEKIGRKLVVVTAMTPQELDAAFSALPRQRVDGLIVTATAFADDHRDKLAVLAARYAIPTIFPFRENVAAGGLMSYGIDINESFRLVGIYAGRVLKGEKPADMPVQQAAKFELFINLRTAKALGLEIPSGVLAIVDQVIE
jgi:putative tryptophan/tyrosine transport system substrate-binding protein